MAKMKTHKGAAKRFKKTASGRLKRKRAGKAHLTGKKSAKRIRQLRKSGLVSESDQSRITQLLPYN